MTARRLGITRAYCCRLLERCRANPTVTAALPNVRGRPQGAQMLRPEIEALIKAAIDEVYLRRSNLTIAMLMREIEKRCFERNLTPPSRKAVTVRIQRRDQRTVLRRRHEAAFARAMLGQVVGHRSVDECDAVTPSTIPRAAVRSPANTGRLTGYAEGPLRVLSYLRVTVALGRSEKLKLIYFRLSRRLPFNDRLPKRTWAGRAASSAVAGER